MKKLKNDTLLVECSTFQQAKNLLGTETFFGANVSVSAHPSLNSCKGVIRCRDLTYYECLDEIKSNLKAQTVSDVRRISVIPEMVIGL